MLFNVFLKMLLPWGLFDSIFTLKYCYSTCYAQIATNYVILTNDIFTHQNYEVYAWWIDLANSFKIFHIIFGLSPILTRVFSKENLCGIKRRKKIILKSFAWWFISSKHSPLIFEKWMSMYLQMIFYDRDFKW